MHGAFTGGFSAGYFNTVGSEEGWTPSTFVSSRSSGGASGGGAAPSRQATTAPPTTHKREQRPEDFMDDEDLAEIRGQEIVRSKVFRQGQTTTTTTATAAPSRAAAQRSEMLPPPPPPPTTTASISAAERLLLQTLTAPSDPIGIQLLRLMGWRSGQGIGARRKRKDKKNTDDIHAAQYLFAPENTQVIRMDQRPAGEFHGLGYRENKQSLAKLHAYHPPGANSSSSSMSSSFPSRGSSMLPKGSAFGYGALEEEDEDDRDIYGMDSRMQYDLEQREEDEEEERVYGASKKHGNIKPGAPLKGPTKSSDGRPVLKGFALASRPLMAIQWYDGPKVPSDFVPKHYFLRSSTAAATAIASATPVDKPKTALERGQLLGEKPLPDVASTSALDKGKKASDIAAEQQQQQYGEPASWPTLPVPLAKAALAGFMPFGNDAQKQSRYRAFLAYHAKTGSLEAYTEMTEVFFLPAGCSPCSHNLFVHSHARTHVPLPEILSAT